MEGIVSVVGWILYGFIALFALSGLLGIAKTASSGGTVTKMGLCQWAFAVASLVAFGFADWNKLHLLWVIPLGFFVSFSPVGQAIGDGGAHTLCIRSRRALPLR